MGNNCVSLYHDKYVGKNDNSFLGGLTDYLCQCWFCCLPCCMCAECRRHNNCCDIRTSQI